MRKSKRKGSGDSSARFTQQAAATQFGVSLRTYKEWESGRRLPAVELLVDVARFYSVSADYLLGLSDTKTAGGDAACNITGLTAATVDFLHSDYELAKNNAAAWNTTLAEWMQSTPYPACSLVLSRMIEKDPEGFLAFMKDIHAYFQRVTEAINATDEQAKYEQEQAIKAALYSCSVSLANNITAAASVPDPRRLRPDL